jgi:hypothetical protein
MEEKMSEDNGITVIVLGLMTPLTHCMKECIMYLGIRLIVL